jgi:DNA processing protein
MAVPGSPLDPRAQGCNQLIRDGATLIQSAADIGTIRPIGPAHRVAAPRDRASTAPSSEDASEPNGRRVMVCSARCRSPVDELIRQSGLRLAIVQTILLELELAGRLDRHAGGRVSRRLKRDRFKRSSSAKPRPYNRLTPPGHLSTLARTRKDAFAGL